MKGKYLKVGKKNWKNGKGIRRLNIEVRRFKLRIEKGVRKIRGWK